MSTMMLQGQTRRSHINQVLITGAAGFIGLSLAYRLVEKPNTKLVLVDKVSPDESDEALRSLVVRPNVQFVGADLMQPGSLDHLPHDIDLIFHGAAILGVQQ